LIAYFSLPLLSFSQDGLGLSRHTSEDRSSSDASVIDADDIDAAASSNHPLALLHGRCPIIGIAISPLYASGRAGDQWRVGPSVSRITRRWIADLSTAHFQPHQDDECLVPCFDSFRHSQRPRVALLDAMMELSGAIGHISASVLDAMRSFTDYLRRFYPEDEPFQDLLTFDVDPWVAREIAAPLYDSSRLAVSLYSHAAVSVRAGVVDCADEAVHPVLRRTPPKDGFSSATLRRRYRRRWSLLISRTPSRLPLLLLVALRHIIRRTRSTKSSTALDLAAAAASSSTTTSLKKLSRNARGRSSRGGGRGRGKK